MFLPGAFSSASLNERFNDFAYISREDTQTFPNLQKEVNSLTECWLEGSEIVTKKFI